MEVDVMKQERLLMSAILAVAAAFLLSVAAPAHAQPMCGTQPATAHVNGLGQNFYDCMPLATPGTASTYNQTLAAEARAAWAYQGTDAAASSMYPRALLVYRQTATACAVWAYSGAIAGHVHLNAANNTCYTPSATDPFWR
jgi:hypothetical protein